MPTKPKVATAFRLSTAALKMLAAVAKRDGTSKTGVIEALIRKAYRDLDGLQ